MAHYRIVEDTSGGFTAEVTLDDGSLEIVHDFPDRAAALAWVSERLVVAPENAQDAMARQRHEPR